MNSITLDRYIIEQNLSLVLGKRVSLCNPEIQYLTKTDLKKAYFKRAKETHPDRAQCMGLNERLLEERFRLLQNAYTILEESWNKSLLYTILSDPKPQKTKNKVSPKPEKTPSDSKKTPFYTVRYIPSLRLRLGEYLYYTRKIDWETFISALTWQIMIRPKIGDLALEKGFLTNKDIISIIKKRKQGELFGETAIRLGKLNPYQVTILCGRQRLLNFPLGKYFLDKGILSQTQLDASLKALQRHNLFACNKHKS